MSVDGEGPVAWTSQSGANSRLFANGVTCALRSSDLFASSLRWMDGVAEKQKNVVFDVWAAGYWSHTEVHWLGMLSPRGCDNFINSISTAANISISYDKAQGYLIKHIPWSTPSRDNGQWGANILVNVFWGCFNRANTNREVRGPQSRMRIYQDAALTFLKDFPMEHDINLWGKRCTTL